MAPSDSRVLSLSLSLPLAPAEIGIVINRHGLSPLRTHAHPTLRNTEGKQEEQCQKAFIPDSLSDTARVSPFLHPCLAAVVSPDAHACPGRARLSRVYPWTGAPFPLLLLPEINEIARRYDRYSRASGPTSSTFVRLRCSYTRFH